MMHYIWGATGTGSSNHNAMFPQNSHGLLRNETNFSKDIIGAWQQCPSLEVRLIAVVIVRPIFKEKEQRIHYTFGLRDINLLCLQRSMLSMLTSAFSYENLGLLMSLHWSESRKSISGVTPICFPS